jgi:hypothetical protein
MNLSAPQNPQPCRKQVSCHACEAEFILVVHERIETLEGIARLVAGTLNCAPCPKCGMRVEAEDVSVYVLVPELELAPLQYLPGFLLECSEVVEKLVCDGMQERLVFSLEELAWRIQAHLVFANHAVQRLKPARELEVPGSGG